jgi:hypothetical protein
MRNLICVLALGTLALAAQASTILPLTFPNADPAFTATVDTGAGTLNLATPFGPDTLAVYDNTPSFVGPVFITDGGTPGNLILSINGGLTEEVALFFDTADAQLVGSNLIIQALGVPVTPVTDPALSLLSGGPWNFSFKFVSPTTNIAADVAAAPVVFDFSGATFTAVPEPSMASVMGIGLLALFSAFQLRKKVSQ